MLGKSFLLDGAEIRKLDQMDGINVEFRIFEILIEYFFSISNGFFSEKIPFYNLIVILSDLLIKLSAYHSLNVELLL